MRGKWMFGKVVCGLLACVFFVMLVVGFFQGLPKQIMVVILLLHSLFLLLLAFIFSSERNDYTGAEDLQQELAVVRSKAEEEKATMQRALDARERELKSQTEDVERMQKEREDERREVEHLRLELEAAHAEQAQHEDISEFLPPPETDEPEVIDIIRAARDIASEMGSTASAAGIQIRISCAEETLLVRAHPSRIRILFRNIIDNSIKYMSRSGSLFITISTIDDDIFIVLKDTGEGLREEETR
ncbi:MAG: HAMP domain-containing histidine kinase, partial [Butyrivibrio sp.]|nr:HAMP domain-containing histidine kinase [Butyrivibrio sp.]